MLELSVTSPAGHEHMTNVGHTLPSTHQWKLPALCQNEQFRCLLQ
uniref:Uncharacterized protein n=1 Tax=Arundo donax TaxID=35708 RepID=A0A0A8YI18_ARUDO